MAKLNGKDPDADSARAFLASATISEIVFCALLGLLASPCLRRALGSLYLLVAKTDICYLVSDCTRNREVGDEFP